jgi:hypothetical protein
MKIRFFALAALPSSTVATAAAAPSQQSMTECKLNRVAVQQQIGKLTLINTETEGDMEWDDYEITRSTYRVDTRPFGLPVKQVVYIVDDDYYDGAIYELEVQVDTSYDVAKARMLAAYGAASCRFSEGAAPYRSCAMPVESRSDAAPVLRERASKAKYNCLL